MAGRRVLLLVRCVILHYAYSLQAKWFSLCDSNIQVSFDWLFHYGTMCETRFSQRSPTKTSQEIRRLTVWQASWILYSSKIHGWTALFGQRAFEGTIMWWQKVNVIPHKALISTVLTGMDGGSAHCCFTDKWSHHVWGHYYSTHKKTPRKE